MSLSPSAAGCVSQCSFFSFNGPQTFFTNGTVEVSHHLVPSGKGEDSDVIAQHRQVFLFLFNGSQNFRSLQERDGGGLLQDIRGLVHVSSLLSGECSS